jgi:two-component system, NtrC family, response regulator AtoC
MAEHPRILIIDDQWGQPGDPMMLETYANLPYTWLLESAQDGGQFSVDRALQRVHGEKPTPDAVLLDISFGDRFERLGVDILEAIRKDFPTLPVLIFTSLDSSSHRELVVTCMELGANEFIEKVPTPQRMGPILQAYVNLHADLALYGNSLAIRALRARIARIAFSGETSVLVVGESGTGKELVARAMHRQGPKSNGPFVAKNCADSESQLLDSELFGHERGAFTGAAARRIGLLEEANGGALFLDEVADMPLSLQAKLLRALETRTIRRLGGSTDITTSFQLLCATNRNPEDLIASGKLREDFFYRIAAVTLHVAPLRERGEDISVLAELFLKRFKARGGASYPGQRFSAAFLKRLTSHDWPGNVRELRNVVERAVILSTTPSIALDDFPPRRHERNIDRINTDRHFARNDKRGYRLPEKPSEWSYSRLVAELELAVEAKRRIQEYKGLHWKAEFMRLLYPECRAANAKGFDDLLKRLTQGPWGCSTWNQHEPISKLIEILRK